MAFGQFKPFEEPVQGGNVAGRFASSALTTIAAGPPSLGALGSSILGSAFTFGSSDNSAGLVYPIGLLQSYSMGQNQQRDRIFEIGSERSVSISGRVAGGIGIRRAVYHGPSLLRVLYAYYQDILPPTTILALFPNVGLATMANPHDVKVPPGYGNIYLNLASDLFHQLVGLLFKLHDSNEDVLGAVYAEQVGVNNHTIDMQSGNVVITEQVQLEYERLVPVACETVDLVQSSATAMLGL